MDILVVEIARLDVALLVVVGALEDRAAPLTQQSLGDALDADLGLLALGVEQDDLADAAGPQRLLLDREAGQRLEDLSLDVVGREGAVVEGLEEELDVLQEVGVGVHDGRLVVVAVEQRHDLRQELELVQGRLVGFARLVVCLAGVLHADLEVCDSLVQLIFQVLD